MADTATATEEQVQSTVPEGRKEFSVNSDALAGSMWGVEPAAQTPPDGGEAPKTIPAEVPKVEPLVEPLVEPSAPWIKEFGWDSEDAAKAEIKKLKEQTPAEIKFENEQSRQMYDLLKSGNSKEVKQFLDKQEKLESYISGEVTQDVAEGIIKLSMQIKNPDLTDAEVAYKFNKSFGFPKEPVQNDDELDEEFSDRQQAWQEQVDDIKMSRIVEAKDCRPEIEKQKAQLILPELSKQGVQAEPTQEELAAAKAYNDAYIQSVDDSIKNFNGFSVAIRHEERDLPITYGVTDEEKTSIAGQLKDFAKSNYDANVLFASRWVGEDGVLKPEQMIRDLSVLNNYEKAFQKFASDSSSKTLEAFLKNKKNINVNALNQQGTTTLAGDEKTELDAVRDDFFGR